MNETVLTEEEEREAFEAMRKLREAGHVVAHWSLKELQGVDANDMHLALWRFGSDIIKYRTGKARVTDPDDLTVRSLQAYGYAIAIFEPEELNGASPRMVEEFMVQDGWNTIEQFGVGRI